MFYYLNGKLAMTDLNTAVIDCGGVGYALTISGNTLGRLAGKTDETVKLYTYMSVREDAVELFGFISLEELSSFKMLISVSGVGPKAAMAILSLLTPEQFALAVASGDAKSISRAKGVGAKTAQRIILELKDKILKGDGAASDATELFSSASRNEIIEEASIALQTLGFAKPAVQKAIQQILKITPDAKVESIIKSALQIL